MIYLFTDFGFQGPYVGELHAVFGRMLPNARVINLMHDAPVFNPRASAYLLAALSRRFQSGDMCLGVVDPDVGIASRRAVLIEADGVTYCGPDNGLFSQVIRRANTCHCNEILWQPRETSASFHGRDVFAPALARHATGTDPHARVVASHDLVGHDWPPQFDEVVYFDHFGNAVLGRQAATLSDAAEVGIGDARIRHAGTFAEVEEGEAFWYENSMGLVELAMNRSSIRDKLALRIGSKVSVIDKNV